MTGRKVFGADSDTRFRILFICARASCRSPMAAGFAQKLLPKDVRIDMAGVTPRGRIDPLAIHVMKLKGIGIHLLQSRALTPKMAEDADLVVLLATADEHIGPLPLPEKVVQWQIEDPLGWPVDIYEDVRDEIEQNVRQLADWLTTRVFAEEILEVKGPDSMTGDAPLAQAPALG